MSSTNKKTHYPLTGLISWFFLTASILAFVYTYYRAELIYSGQLNEHYFKYYLASLTGVVFWCVVLRLGKEVRANIVTFVISLAVGLYGIEGALTFWEIQQTSKRAEMAANLGVEYDERTKLEVVKDLMLKGVGAVPSIHPSSLIGLLEAGTNREGIEDLFPLGGISNKITVLDKETGKWVVFKSDRHGFNNPDGQWDEPNIEWVLTGDSFIQGYGSEPGEDIAGQIRNITNNDAISLGMGGNGPLAELAALLEYGTSTKSKKILWTYFEGNDLLNDLSREKDSPLLKRYLENGFSQNLINRQQEVDSVLAKYSAKAQIEAQDREQEKTTLIYKARWIKFQAIQNLIFSRSYRTFMGTGFNSGLEVNIDPLFSKILAKAKTSTEAWGGKLYFIYLPEYSRYKNITAHHQYRKKSEVIAVVKELGIPIIDIHQEVFSAHPDPISLFPLRLSGHYNKKGNQEVARVIIEKTKSN